MKQRGGGGKGKQFELEEEKVIEIVTKWEVGGP